MNTAKPNPLKLKYPIVLIHGLGARGIYGNIEYFYGLAPLLRKAGNQTLSANLTGWQTIAHRATELKTQIEHAFPEGKVNLVGHSMGGLDARYLTSALGFEGRVASVTTIGTPNHGSILADIALGIVPGIGFTATEKLMGLMGATPAAFKEFTTEYMTEDFILKSPDISSVAYFSASSVIRGNIFTRALPLFWVPHPLISKLEGENDGFVSLESSRWGTHICTYEGDHYAQIGQILGRTRGMDYVCFYREIFSRLRKEGM
ncbi:MAG: alpha/beta fold hydrolase, partial [Bdellovibrionota bacterium]